MISPIPSIPILAFEMASTLFTHVKDFAVLSEI